jgi:hypothetical protein
MGLKTGQIHYEYDYGLKYIIFKWSLKFYDKFYVQGKYYTMGLKTWQIHYDYGLKYIIFKRSLKFYALCTGQIQS